MNYRQIRAYAFYGIQPKAVFNRESN